MSANGGETKKLAKKSEKKPDITFFHPDLLQVPADGSPPFLTGYRCKSCGSLDFPKPTICLHCWCEDFEAVPLSRTGVLYSVTDIFIGQAGMKTPYVFGYVDLPENLRILAQMQGETGTFKCDDQVELVVGTIRMNRDGLPITSYMFKKVAS